MAITRFKYSGSVPGAVSTEFTLFDTTTANPGAMGGNFFSMLDIARFKVTMNILATGTLKTYRSHDAGKSWMQDWPGLVAVPASGPVVKDWLVEGAKDWKVTWTNGGTTQAAVLTGNVDMTGLNYAAGGDVDQKTIRFHVDGNDYEVLFQGTPGNAAAVATAIQAQVGAAVMTAAIAGGTNFLTLTSARGGSMSIIQAEAGSLALATVGLAATPQAIGWMIALDATTDRHPIA
jgi:hypothetical protein